jgi:multisubunit Na+/H+ antiporter MnhG subunit
MTITKILNTALFILCTNCIIAQTISKTEYTFDINQKVNNVDYYYYFNKGKNDTFINLK